MHIEQIDRYCDFFEQRLKQGDELSAEQFLQEQHLPAEVQLLTELRRLEHEYRDERFAVTAAFLDRSPPSEFEAIPPLPGRYRPVAKIAQGGMGAVWRVVDQQFDRPLAIKVMLPKWVKDSAALARFEREAQLTGSLQHPAIPPVVDRGRLEDGSPYFSMKLVEGETLAHLLAQHNARSPTERASDLPRLLGVFEQVCHTVGYAHAQGIIHRDLKPANVMVGAFGEVQVMDWGMATLRPGDRQGSPAGHDGGGGRPSVAAAVSVMDSVSAVAPTGDTAFAPPTGAGSSAFSPEGPTVGQSGTAETADELTRAGTVLGTPAYMPPEQARGETDRLDARSDVFGLGAILCEILSGRRPYSGSDAWQQAARGDVREAFARLDKFSVDHELVDLCKRCLAPDPSVRPGDGSAVAGEVRRWRATVQVRLEHERTERAKAVVQAVEERKRRRVLLALAYSLLVLFAGGGAVAWSYQRARIAREVEAATTSRDAEEEIRGLLAQSAELRDRYDFATAGILLSQADRRAAVVLDRVEIVERLAQASADLDLAQKLDAIRMSKATSDAQGNIELRFANGVDGAYSRAFREYGIEISGSGDSAAPTAATRIQQSLVKRVLLAALDDWAKDETDHALRDQVLKIARAGGADPLLQGSGDPAAWRDQALEILSQDDLAPFAPATLVSVAWRLHDVGENVAAAQLLTRAARSHPQDYWVQFTLANTLSAELTRPEAAIGYYRAAIAIRPGDSAAHNNLGVLLLRARQLEAAEAHFQKAIAANADSHLLCANLGEVLRQRKKLAESITASRRAVALDDHSESGWNNLGIALLEQDQADEAAAAFQKVLTFKPDSVAAWDNLGAVLCSQKRMDEAVAAHQTALWLDRLYPPAWTNLGIALSHQQKTEEALTAHRCAVALDDRSSVAWLNLGGILRELEQLDEALDAFRKAVQLDRQNAKAWLGVGFVLDQQSQLDEAIRAFKEATLADPGLVEAWISLAQTLQKGNDLAGAVVAYENALELDAQDAQSWNNLGELYRTQQRLDDALRAYQKALDVNPKYALAWSNTGVVYANRREFAKAIDAFNEALAIDPKLAVAWHNLGNAFGAQRKWSKAEQAMQNAVQFGPEVAAYRHDLGSSLAEQGNLVEAEAAFRKATELNPDDAMACYSLGTCLLEQKKLSDAVSAFQSAIRLKPDYTNAHFNLGTAFYQQGEYAQAEAAYRRAVELDPSDPSAHGLLGEVLLKQGHFEEAIQATRDAVKLLGFLSPMRLSANQQIRECERLLDLEGRLPGALESSDLATLADLIEMAELCQRYKGRHRDAVTLYEAAFAREPTSPLYSEKLCRYNAACAAIQVAAGSDAGAPPLSEADQAQYRSRALAWIRTEFDALTAIHQISGRLLANQLQEDLRAWQSDPDLAGVRDPESLSRLPDDEQQAWRSLWNDVQLLVDRVGATRP